MGRLTLKNRTNIFSKVHLYVCFVYVLDHIIKIKKT